MSLVQNEQWLESAWDNFQEALKNGNWELCKDIIADTFDMGFPEAARSMNLEMRNTPIGNFMGNNKNL